MKVIEVKHFAIKGKTKSNHTVYYMEGVEHGTILCYKPEEKRFLLAFVECKDKKISTEELFKEIDNKVPFIAKLKINTDKSQRLSQFQLGKVKLHITKYSETEKDFYVEKAKDILSINEKHPLADKTYISGKAKPENIAEYISTLEKTDIQEYKNQLEQSAMQLN